VVRCAILSVAVLALVCSGPALLATSGQDPTNAPGPTAETPTQFYIRYLKAVMDAKSVEDVLALWRTELVNEFKQAPADQRVDLDGLKRMYGMRKDVKVTGETLGATGATLSLEAVGPDQKRMTGTAYLVKEKGQWKLFGQETWQ
jgi:hypothetical protein